jgi:DNA-binding NarL/FixJ family response regulator
VVIVAGLHDGDPVELLRGLPAHLDGPRVLALVRLSDTVTINRLLEIGVQGLVETSQPIEILRDALLELAAGGTYRTAPISRLLTRLRADPDAFPKFLTGREQDLLRHVLAGGTNRTIAERLQLSPRSVETFRYRLMRKLGVRNLAGLIQYALRQGLLGR